MFHITRQSMTPQKLVFIVFALSVLIHIVCMTSINLLVEEAYYWNYSQHLDFSYLDHPPMIALLIKCSTILFGASDFSVRWGSLICYFMTMYFSYKLTEHIAPKTGLYSVMLLAILPFYFFQTLVMTPDLPLLAFWSATLYCLYRVLVLKQPHYWYFAGVTLGAGMLSKYTISLLGLATLCYLIWQPSARFWFKRKEPYLAAIIAIVLFSPVIYWNMTHEWISFLFQSTRRFASTTSIDLHYLITLVFLFITPLGVFSLWELLKKSSGTHSHFKPFLRTFVSVPLGFFALYSLNHEINLNWIGPIFLALIPWIALYISDYQKRRALWMRSAFLLLVCYASIIALAAYNTSEQIQKKLFIKLVAWEPLIKQFHQLAQHIETETQKKPVFIPLDNFPIGSELSFYQSKLLHQGIIKKTYPIIGPHIFGLESLMYRYWSDERYLLEGTPVILISKELWRFEMPDINRLTTAQSQVHTIWSYGQGMGVKNIPFYYKIVVAGQVA